MALAGHPTRRVIEDDQRIERVFMGILVAGPNAPNTLAGIVAHKNILRG
jgi:hypothetical protein